MPKSMMTEGAVKKRNLISVFSGIICLFVLSLLYIELVKHDLKSEKERYGYIAMNEADHIATTIDCVMARTNTLEAMIQDHNGDTTFFDSVAGTVYSDVVRETGVKLKNFAIAPDGVVSNVYPLEGNESLIGFNFLDTSRPGNIEALEAYEKGSTILTNPFELVQGGIGMGGRSPVMINSGNDTRLWGLVTVTIDYENLVDVLKLDNLEGMGVNYTLSYIDNDGSSHIMNAKGESDKRAVKLQFNVRNLTWELAVSPEKGWISALRVILSVILILTLSVFVGVFSGTLLKLRDTNVILLRLSNTDNLTGGLNRTSYAAALSEFSDKQIDDDFIYVSLDLNGLKQTNDTFGHMAGDELIIGASECLCKTFGKAGNIYRIGGDEFAALIKADESSFEKMLSELESLTKEWKGDSINGLSLSVGYASHREFPEASAEMLIRKSDERMYEVKRAYYRSMDNDRRNH
ncbi:MAG: sensor domain-containing diguanylate cyclase [Lachnospiraceae bacterium]|nr:sensor domain-containing diguanylate cyclase [Lachnospiraceae bacterium]